MGGRGKDKNKRKMIKRRDRKLERETEEDRERRQREKEKKEEEEEEEEEKKKNEEERKEEERKRIEEELKRREEEERKRIEEERKKYIAPSEREILKFTREQLIEELEKAPIGTFVRKYSADTLRQLTIKLLEPHMGHLQSYELELKRGTMLGDLSKERQAQVIQEIEKILQPFKKLIALPPEERKEIRYRLTGEIPSEEYKRNVLIPGIEFVRSITAYFNIPTELDIEINVMSRNYGYLGRAYYMQKKVDVVTEENPTATTIHELGHIIDYYKTPEERKRYITKVFDVLESKYGLKRRSFDEFSIPSDREYLKRMYGHYRLYTMKKSEQYPILMFNIKHGAATEEERKRKELSYDYMFRVYPMQTTKINERTRVVLFNPEEMENSPMQRMMGMEITSVAIERLYKNPGKFAQDMPEIFNLTLDYLHGRL